MRELVATFDQRGSTPSWNATFDFPSSSALAGVACVGERVYHRLELQGSGNSDAHVRQQTWDSEALAWKAGKSSGHIGRGDADGEAEWWSRPYLNLANDTSIAAVDWDVFFQFANGSIARMAVDASSREMSEIKTLGLAAESTALAAQTRRNSPPLLFFRDVNNDTLVDYAVTS